MTSFGNFSVFLCAVGDELRLTKEKEEERRKKKEEEERRRTKCIFLKRDYSMERKGTQTLRVASQYGSERRLSE